MVWISQGHFDKRGTLLFKRKAPSQNSENELTPSHSTTRSTVRTAEVYGPLSGKLSLLAADCLLESRSRVRVAEEDRTATAEQQQDDAGRSPTAAHGDKEENADDDASSEEDEKQSEAAATALMDLVDEWRRIEGEMELATFTGDGLNLNALSAPAWTDSYKQFYSTTDVDIIVIPVPTQRSRLGLIRQTAVISDHGVHTREGRNVTDTHTALPHDGPEQRAVPREGLIIPASNSLLKASSPVLLRRLLRLESHHRYNDALRTNDRLKLILCAEEPNSIKTIVRCLYGHTDCLHHVDPSLLPYIIRDATAMRMQPVLKEALRALSRPLGITTTTAIAVLADSLHLDDILLHCINLMAECGFAVLSSGLHLQRGFSANVMRLLLCADNLCVDEVQLKSVLECYINHKIATDMQDPRCVTPYSVLLQRMRHIFLPQNVDNPAPTRPLSTKEQANAPNAAVGYGYKVYTHTPTEFPSLRVEHLPPCELSAMRTANHVLAATGGGGDTALLNGVLRCALHCPLAPRFAPWTANPFYEVDCGGAFALMATNDCSTGTARTTSTVMGSSKRSTTFPIAVSRVKPTRVGSGRQSSDVNPELISMYWSARLGGPWTCGVPRYIKEAYWAFEVERTSTGHIQIGVLEYNADPMSTYSAQLYMFDTMTRHFYTTGATRANYRAKTSHSAIVEERHLESSLVLNSLVKETRQSSILWPRQLRPGDILALRLSVTKSQLNFSLTVLQQTSRLYHNTTVHNRDSTPTAPHHQAQHDHASTNDLQMAASYTFTLRGGGVHTAGTTGVHTAGTTGVHTAGTTGVHTAGTTGVHTAGTTGVHTAGTTGVPASHFLYAKCSPWFALQSEGDALKLPALIDSEKLGTFGM